MAKHITLTMNNRTFECHYCSEIGGKMCSITFCEIVRPTWKIFRTTLYDTSSFWVDDYPTIREGIEACLSHLLNVEAKDKERNEKWKDV